MGNTNMGKSSTESLPVETMFKLPSQLPSWPPGDGFASGIIDLGGLQVCQTSSFHKVWACYEDGPDNLGVSIFEPSALPEGFFMLGCYSQSNNMPLFGWSLVAKDITLENANGGALKQPIDYTLVWSTETLSIKQDNHAYIWFPTPPDGYKALGHVVTTSPEKPSLGKIRCVRSDFTEQCESESVIWGQGNSSQGVQFHYVRPSNRGTQALGVCVGTFAVQITGDAHTEPPVSIACLKNNSKANYLASMPNKTQIEALIQAYSPFLYFHPDEQYLPSSVDWFFSNGGLLYKKGEESSPVRIEPNGSNLPQDGPNDGTYWLDLPVDETDKERVKKGDLQSFKAYVHVKRMLGGTFTDIVFWLFYPFNGPSRAKLELLDVKLGRIGQHVGDWEHVTLRLSNFNGELRRVYFSQHSKGTWVDASQLEYRNGNKSVVYSALHGHPCYPKPGLVLQGQNGIGIRNDAAKSNLVVDIGGMVELVAVDYLGSAIRQPPWLNYNRKWGPKIRYQIEDEIEGVLKLVPGRLKSALENFIRKLPNEVFEEEGPTGPKLKRNWDSDEI